MKPVFVCFVVVVVVAVSAYSIACAQVMQTIIVDYLRMSICLVDGCHHYQNLTDAERKYDHETEVPGKCDDTLHGKGWYRFVGAAGTKMATKSPEGKKCGAPYPAWLSGVHPTVAEGTVRRDVCINKNGVCKEQSFVDVKNCTFYYVYKFYPSKACNFRYCGTD